MSLNEEPEIVTWPETHYVFVERVGPFEKNAPEAWGTLHSILGGISKSNTVTGYMSLYKRGPQIYRAGVSLSGGPEELPEGVEYAVFEGGKYSRFVLTGPYSQLAEASGRVFDVVSERGIAMRDDFCIENYVKDPRVTPVDELVTEILIPTI
ncbi:MAG TPA: GyrI-like domain-containing protein [Acidisarcina sp.]